MPLGKGQTVRQLRRLFLIMPRRRVKSLMAVFPLSVVSGLLDLAIVAVAARMAGSLVGQKLNDSIPGIKVFGGSHGEQALWLVLIFIVLSWLGSISKLLLKVLQQRLTAQVWRDISDRMLGRVIGQPYDYFLTTKGTAISAQLMVNMQRVSDLIVEPILAIVSSSIVIICLAVALVFSLGLQALFLLFLLGLAYLLTSSLVVPYLRHASKQTVRLNELASSILSQSFHSIRDIHLTHTAEYFESRFIKAGESAKSFQWLSKLLPDVPRFVIEPLGITLIFVVALLPTLGRSGFTESGKLAVTLIPFLTTFVVASIKLTPPLQDLFRALVRLRGALPEVDSALSYLELPLPRRSTIFANSPTPEGLFPLREISLHDVSFQYPRSDQEALRSISMNFPVGSRIALMGSTGSGKTTLSNILLAHLEPTRGEVRLDGIPLMPSDISTWQNCCAEVPQHIYLLDGSIKQNVAFGVDEEEIDIAELWDALSAAQLSELVEELQYGIYTHIGEDGLNLSGGQRQRLALARAFYRKAKFLVLDEATSSLDEKTESDVINSLDIIARRCTTVVIAHRLNTLAKCDYIYEVKDGVVESMGTYRNLCDPHHPLGLTVKNSSVVITDLHQNPKSSLESFSSEKI